MALTTDDLQQIKGVVTDVVTDAKLELRAEMAELGLGLRSEMSELRVEMSELKVEVSELRVELKDEIKGVRTMLEDDSRRLDKTQAQLKRHIANHKHNLV